MSKDILPVNDLTPAGILRRRNERCRTHLGISFTALATLTACVVRWCCYGSLLSTRKDVADAVAEDASVLSPAFYELAKLGLVEVARSESTRSYYRPTRRGLLRIIEWGGVRERERELAGMAAE